MIKTGILAMWIHAVSDRGKLLYDHQLKTWSCKLDVLKQITVVVNVLVEHQISAWLHSLENYWSISIKCLSVHFLCNVTMSLLSLSINTLSWNKFNLCSNAKCIGWLCIEIFAGSMRLYWYRGSPLWSEMPWMRQKHGYTLTYY